MYRERANHASEYNGKPVVGRVVHHDTRQHRCMADIDPDSSCRRRERETSPEPWGAQTGHAQAVREGWPVVMGGSDKEISSFRVIGLGRL
jgi:hypothetical protein